MAVYPPKRSKTAVDRRYYSPTLSKRTRTHADKMLYSDEMNDDWAGQDSGRGARVEYIPLNKANKHFLATVSTQTQTEQDHNGLPMLLPHEKSTMTQYLAERGTNVPPAWESRPDSRPPTGYRSSEDAAGMSVPYNNFYQRLKESRPNLHNKYYTDPGPPVFRTGSFGAPWRHIRQCTGNLGNHICFVDGVVKQDDMVRYPPFGYEEPVYGHCLFPPKMSAPRMRRSCAGERMGRPNRNIFHQHARQGFKYWHEDKKPSVLSKQTIQGRMMKLGVGY